MIEEKCEKCKGKKYVLVRKKFTIKAPKGVNTNNIMGITNNKKQKLFTIYEGLKLFLSKKEYKSLTKKLRELLSLLGFKLKDIIDINDILYKMDFPKDWHK